MIYLFTIDGKKKIKIVKGDTAILDLNIKNHTFVVGDKVYFTVKESVDDTVKVIQKIVTTFENNIAKVILSKEDTNVEVGSYLYDIQLSLLDGRVDTVVAPTKFEVIGGVTHD